MSVPATSSGPSETSSEGSSLDSLPDDIVLRILTLLQPCQLHWTERVSKRFRQAVVQHNLWRQHCCSGASNFDETVSGVDTESLKQIVNELSKVAEAQSNTPGVQTALKSTAKLAFGSDIPPLSASPPLQSDSDIQHSRPPITVTPFWGPGLSAAAAATQSNHNPDAASSSQATAEPTVALQPRRYSRDGNLPTSREASQNPSREGSTHGSSSLWQFSRSIPDDVLRSMFYKKLCWRLGAGPAQESLIARALQASSTDDAEREDISNVLQPKTRSEGLWVTFSYWSSTGSKDKDSIETLDFELAHPLCLVKAVLIKPFKALFQSGHPIYPPQKVKFHFGMHKNKADPAAGFEFLFSSPEYPVEHTNNLQSFELPSVLAVGGVMRVELIGRVQRQTTHDDRYYTCIDYLKLVGTPLYGFEPRGTGLALTPPADPPAEPSRAVVLKAVSPDQLTAAGGLFQVSEMGRHFSNALAAGADAASDADEGPHGDSDDGDFAQEQGLMDIDNIALHDEQGNVVWPQGAGLNAGQQLQLVMHPLNHFAGLLDPHDHDGEYPLMDE